MLRFIHTIFCNSYQYLAKTISCPDGLQYQLVSKWCWERETVTSSFHSLNINMGIPLVIFQRWIYTKTSEKVYYCSFRLCFEWNLGISQCRNSHYCQLWTSISSKLVVWFMILHFLGLLHRLLLWLWEWNLRDWTTDFWTHAVWHSIRLPIDRECPKILVMIYLWWFHSFLSKTSSSYGWKGDRQNGNWKAVLSLSEEYFRFPLTLEWNLNSFSLL